jgi:hypothetical protein
MPVFKNDQTNMKSSHNQTLGMIIYETDIL